MDNEEIYKRLLHLKRLMDRGEIDINDVISDDDMRKLRELKETQNVGIASRSIG